MEHPCAHPAPAGPGPAPGGADVPALVRAVVAEALDLGPDDFDWKRSPAELGCDSLDLIDIQYRLERAVGVPDLGLAEAPDFNPLTAPLERLADYVRARVPAKGGGPPG